ncbi:MAG: hypothetical protein KR126chlam2_00222 [Chlamydiae bacterium]|nr:hypothetical protein [Chlamydiota bacterium]
MKLYVGNLPYALGEEDLKELFSEFESIVSIQLITDRETGKSRGFGFVELSSQDEGNKAIDELNEKMVEGKAIIVNEARPKQKREGSFGGGGGNFGGGNKRRY